MLTVRSRRENVLLRTLSNSHNYNQRGNFEENPSYLSAELCLEGALNFPQSRTVFWNSTDRATAVNIARLGFIDLKKSGIAARKSENYCKRPFKKPVNWSSLLPQRRFTYNHQQEAQQLTTDVSEGGAAAEWQHSRRLSTNQDMAKISISQSNNSKFDCSTCWTYLYCKCINSYN